MDPAVQQAVELLRARIAEIRPLVDELPRLEQALMALEKGSAEERPHAPAARSAPVVADSTAGRTRFSADERQRQVLAFMQTKSPVRTGELVAELGLSRVRVGQLIAQLVEQGRITKAAKGRYTLE